MTTSSGVSGVRSANAPPAYFAAPIAKLAVTFAVDVETFCAVTVPFKSRTIRCWTEKAMQSKMAGNGHAPVA